MEPANKELVRKAGQQQTRRKCETSAYLFAKLKSHNQRKKQTASQSVS